MADADREGGHTDEDMEDYTHRSEVPPPPTYDEAVKQDANSAPAFAAGGYPVESPPRQLRPLSQIDTYKSSWLFPLMMRVKDTLHNVRKGLKKMEDDTGSFGDEIRNLEVKSYEEMVSLFMMGIVNRLEGDFLSAGAQSLLDSSAFRNSGTGPLNSNYVKLKGQLQNDMRVIRSWIREQLIQDREWSEKKPRIPTISNVELRDMKTAMMKVESKRTSLESLRSSRSKDLTNLKDYATDMLLKMDMENLWSLLTRMGDDEMGEEFDEQPVEPPTPTPAEEEEEEEEDKEDDEENSVAEDDTERLRQKRLDYYNKGKAQEARRSGSDEDKEQLEEMVTLPKTAPSKQPSDKGEGDDDEEDEEAKDSIATGGMAAVSNTEEDRLRMRRMELYRQDSKPAKAEEAIAEEIEMLPVVGVVSEDDIDVDASSLPRSQSPNSYSEAVADSWLDVDRYSPKHSAIVDPVAEPRTVHQFEVDEPDAESGRRTDRRRRRRKYDVGSMPIPFLREIINFLVGQVQHVKDHWPEWSNQKRLILVFSVLFVVGLVLLVSLLPASFVYVDYYEMGFVYNRATGKTDTDRVYDFGCYLMAPQHSLVLYPSTAHFLDLDLSVMNKAGLTIGLEVYLQYLLRPSELPQMYNKYHGEYKKIIEIMAESTVKNMAIEFTLEEYRLNRPMVEARLFHKLKRVLSGDCCNVDNDRYKRFQTSYSHNSTANESNACNTDAATCNHGFHIDLAFFQLGAISIPSAVMSHYLKQVTLRVETEKELYVQRKAIEVKETSLRVQNISNQANEIREQARAESAKIKVISEASRLKLVEQSYVSSLKMIFDKLNIQKEEEKASLLFLNTLKNIKHNLVAFSYNYDKETVSSP